MMLTISKLRCRGSDSDFRCVAMEIGMLLNVFLRNKTAYIFVFKYV